MSWIKKSIGFDDKWLMLVGIPIVAFVITNLLFANTLLINTQKFFTICTFISLVYTTIFWLCFRPVFAYFHTRYPKTQNTLRRLSLQLGSVLVGYFFLKKILDVTFLEYVKPYLEDQTPPPEILENMTGLLVILLIVAIYEGTIFYTKLQKSLHEKEQLQRDNIQSQLEGLKNQVNPHFLFNSLNTLMHLIPEDQERASSFVQKLSKVYRYILEIKDRKIISLSEELEFLHAYIFLLKERFGENIQTNINIPKEFLEQKIVPLSLQILFENAIKHNIISTKQPLAIDVFIEKNNTPNSSNKLIVKNNLQKKNQVANSTKTGLQNIRNRYGFFSEEQVDVIVTSHSFLVALPLIEKIEEEKRMDSNEEDHLKPIRL